MQGFDQAVLLPLLVFGGGFLFLIVSIVMGLAEAITGHRLSKRGKAIEGQIVDVDFKSSRPGGVYGKVCFTYRVNDRTYTKKQTVDKYTAMAFLSGMPTLSLFAEPKKVSVLFLPNRPSVARLATAPSDLVRKQTGGVAFAILIFIVVLFAAIVLVSMKQGY